MNSKGTQSSDYQRIAKAIRFLETRVHEQPGLSELASHLRLSDYHFQRLFRRWAGITPKDFLQVLTLMQAKELLAQSNSLMQTSLALGLSGPGRLHDLFVNIEGMTPGQYKAKGAGLIIHWAFCATPLGETFLAVNDRGVCAFEFIERKYSKQALIQAQERWPEAEFKESPQRVAGIAEEIRRRMHGEGQEPLTLLLKGSPFQIKIWEALLRIPEGKVLSYQGLATQAGNPRASRAVGSALGANPIAYLIPCHRVIQATGAVGQYRWGRERKTALLAMEVARQRINIGG